jgi:hypothetical protein
MTEFYKHVVLNRPPGEIDLQFEVIEFPAMTVTPVRLRLSRARGFDLQAASRAINGLPAMSVARPTKWGNPHDWREWLEAWRYSTGQPNFLGGSWCRDRAAQAFQEDLAEGGDAIEKFKTAVRTELLGHNLACWCGLCAAHAATGRPAGADCAVCAPCHADTLLELANR